jgi:hypothetical protein
MKTFLIAPGTPISFDYPQPLLADSGRLQAASTAKVPGVHGQNGLIVL